MANFIPQKPKLPEGASLPDPEKLANLVEWRKRFPRTTATVHGNLKQGLMPGDDGYDLGTAEAEKPTPAEG